LNKRERARPLSISADRFMFALWHRTVHDVYSLTEHHCSSVCNAEQAEKVSINIENLIGDLFARHDCE
jgi:hypothetical protein